MSRGQSWWVLVGVLMLGCTTKDGRRPAPTPPSSSHGDDDPSDGSEGQPIPAAATRIYMLGEERYAQGRFDEAVALWGHAMLQLPADPSADRVRHKLIARMGYGLLQAHHATGDLSYLVDGQAMCERYLAKHEALFGDGEPAQAQRGEIYELLYEFDSRLDGAPSEGPPLDEPLDEPRGVGPAAAATGSEPTAEAEARDEAPAADEESEDYRIINVRRTVWADADDPRVREFQRDLRFTGPSMLDIGREHAYGRRVLVRAGALPRTTAEVEPAERKAARAAGLAVIDAARPALEQCYEHAMTRDPVFAARIEVVLTVASDGTVTGPRVTSGMVIDAEGDACTAQALRRVRIEPPSGDAVELAMPIHFFYQEGTRAEELIRIEHPGSRKGYVRTNGAPGLPPIDEFGLIAEPYVQPHRRPRMNVVQPLDTRQGN
ncbi:MAG: AgmX/PglI C-terminal domain-containing protein [Myxococcales bacterium]|nr:AgmX/PglI C-terminal domain-containing protein [Myxococcales bacterium]